MKKEQVDHIIDSIMKNDHVVGKFQKVDRNTIAFWLKDFETDTLKTDTVHYIHITHCTKDTLDILEIDSDSLYFNKSVLTTLKNIVKLDRNYVLSGNKLRMDYIL